MLRTQVCLTKHQIRFWLFNCFASRLWIHNLGVQEEAGLGNCDQVSLQKHKHNQCTVSTGCCCCFPSPPSYSFTTCADFLCSQQVALKSKPWLTSLYKSCCRCCCCSSLVTLLNPEIPEDVALIHVQLFSCCWKRYFCSKNRRSKCSFFLKGSTMQYHVNVAMHCKKK